MKTEFFTEHDFGEDEGHTMSIHIHRKTLSQLSFGLTTL